jgi:hypothetical protein
MRYLISFILCILFVLSCSKKDNFITIPLESFKIDNELLKNQELIQVLSFSGMPDLNPKLDYYAHMIIVAKETQDTFNLLTITTGNLLNDEDKEMNFIAQNSTLYSTVIESLKQEHKLTNYQPIKKVIIDEKFENDTKNNYPTVIGMLGTTSKN